MKTLPSPTVVVLSLTVAAAMLASAEDTTPPNSPPATSAKDAPADQGVPATTPAKKKSSLLKIDYKAPAGALGAPAVREAGGTRKGNGDLPAIYVLAPNHVALTTQAQPVLFWYQSAPSGASFKLSLVEPKKPEPLVSATSGKADKSGINALRLTDWKVTLKPGVEYRWNVALIPDPEHQSNAEVAQGVIKRIDPPAGLEEKLSKASLAERAEIYAQAGLWYDALQSISSAIAADPKDDSLHQMRASLLKQGGLGDAAGADK
jgi:hypothetical protein